MKIVNSIGLLSVAIILTACQGSLTGEGRKLVMEASISTAEITTRADGVGPGELLMSTELGRFDDGILTVELFREPIMDGAGDGPVRTKGSETRLESFSYVYIDGWLDEPVEGLDDYYVEYGWLNGTSGLIEDMYSEEPYYWPDDDTYVHLWGHWMYDDENPYGTEVPRPWWDVSEDYLTMTVYDYVTPFSADGTEDALAQEDMIFSYNKGNRTANNGHVNIKLYHALSAVRIDLSNVISKWTVSNMKLIGVMSGGDCDITPSDSGLDFSWTPTGDVASYSQTLVPNDFHAGFSYETENYSRVLARAKVVNPGKMFFMMPQTLPDDAKLALTLYDGVDRVFKEAAIGKYGGASVEWEPGMLYTYKLKYSKEEPLKAILECGNDFAGHIKQTAGGAENIKRVVFRTGVSSTGIHVEDARSTYDIFSVFDSETGTIYIDTEADIVLANEDEERMFWQMPNLTEVVGLQTLDFSSTTDMSSMFVYDESLTSVDLSGIDMSKVKEVYGMFQQCTSLQTVNLTGCDTGSCTNFTNMFGSCSSLTEIKGLAGLDTHSATSLINMFYGCSKLTSIDVSNFDTSNVTGFKGMFGFCTRVKCVDVSGFDTSKATNMSEMFTSFGVKGKCIVGLESFDTSKVTDMSQMFDGCRYEGTLDISNFDTHSCKNMSGMFKGLQYVTNITIDKDLFSTANVTNMGQMFSSAFALKSFDFSGFNTSKVTRMNDFLYNCSAMQVIDLSSFDTSKVTTMSRMFANCSAVKTLKLGSGFVIGTSCTVSTMMSKTASTSRSCKLTSRDDTWTIIGDSAKTSITVGYFTHIAI